MSCNHLCRQGRDCDCAVVAFHAEAEGVMPMTTTCTVKTAPGTHYCAKSRQACSTPYTCSTACKLITANSDGTSAHAPRTGTDNRDRLGHLLRWLARAAVLGFMLSVTASLLFNRI